MILFGILVWVGLAGLYWLLAGQLGASEMIAGAAFASAVCAYACLAHARALRAMHLPARWPLVAFRAAAQLYPDAARVGWALLLGRRGALMSQPFRTGGDGALDAAHRAVAILSVSAAPNAYVLALRHERQDLLLHCLAPRPVHPDQEWPG